MGKLKERINIIINIIKYPPYFLLYLDHARLITLNDKLYIKLQYRNCTGKKLNLDNPQTFNEKLQWLKLYDRNTEYIKLVDKYEVKDYISKKIGEEYVIPTIGIYDSFDEINFEELPNQFVVKTTHDSGGVVICSNKDDFDIEKCKQIINKSLKVNYYYGQREWPYKDIKPRIIVEKYMEDKKTSVSGINDYKFFVFSGKCKLMFIATDRQLKTETCFDFYNEKFEHLPFINGHPNAKVPPEKPENFEKMVELAEKLGQDIPQVRIDFYEINGKIYFGEITFFHWGGIVPFEPEEWDYEIGKWINLPKK